MKNNNSIILYLKKLEKPEKKVIEDKECLICLESIDLESNKKIVKLPCGCANSVYHITCIIKLLYSGKNKNFCPHCKTKYKAPLRKVIIQEPVYVQLPNRELQRKQINELKIKTFTHIMIFHIISNSIMNIINIYVSHEIPQYNTSIELNVLMLFYFLKIFFNYLILLFSKNNFENIESFLIYSYTFQLILFGLLIYSFTKITKNYYFIILVLNNIFLNFADLIFRIIIENKMNIKVNIIG